MATTQDDSMLLGLPMELLQRITGYLPSETLTSVRLTCKTLEGATFDQYVEEYCKVSRWCVLFAARWTKLQKQLRQNPRLASKLKSIVLTTDPYESIQHSRLELAPERHFENISEAQCQAVEYANSNEGLPLWLERYPRPDLAMMIDVIRQLQHASPHIKAFLAIDLPEEHYALCHDIVTAVVSAKLALCDLNISRPFTSASETYLAQHRSGFLDCASSLTSIHFGNEEVEPVRQSTAGQTQLGVVQDIFRSSNNITRLSLYLGEYGFSRRAETVTRSILLAQDHDRLSHLQLDTVVVSEEVLLNILARCRHTLKSIMLNWVKLAYPHREWSAALGMMKDLPLLKRLELEYLLFKDSIRVYPRVCFESVRHGEEMEGKDNHHRMKLYGREVVVAGMNELLSNPLLYCN
jgi:hypothetical protein